MIESLNQTKLRPARHQPSINDAIPDLDSVEYQLKCISGHLQQSSFFRKFKRNQNPVASWSILKHLEASWSILKLPLVQSLSYRWSRKSIGELIKTILQLNRWFNSLSDEFQNFLRCFSSNIHQENSRKRSQKSAMAFAFCSTTRKHK